MSTIIWEDFEGGRTLAEIFTGGVGSTASFDGTHVNDGVQALKISQTGTASGSKIDLPAGLRDLVGRIYFDFPSAPSGTVVFVNIDVGTASAFFRFRSNSISQVAWQGGGSQSGDALLVDAFNVLDFWIDANGANPTIHWRLNGVDQTPLNGAAASGDITQAKLATTGAVTIDYWLDSLRLDDDPATYPLPDGGPGGGDQTLALGHVPSPAAAHGITLNGADTAPLVVPEYTGTPRFVLASTGEQILLRGANTILSANDATSHAAVLNGANAMRLVLNWHDLEPVAPTGSGTDFTAYATSLDSTILSEIDTLCQWYADNGAYIQLDFHQAAWSPYFGGSGVPSWYYTDARFTAQQNGGAGWNNGTDKSTAINHWWTDATESPMSQQLYINFVTAFIQWAQTKAWYPWVFGYETFNELNAGNMTGSSSAKIGNMHAWLAPVVDAMHAIEPDRALFVMCRGGSQGFGTATFAEFGDLQAKNICIEFHQYYTGLAPGINADTPGEVGWDVPGDDYYPDSATVHNTTSGSTYAGAEQYQEAFMSVPLDKAAALGVPAFFGEFGVHYDDTGRLDYAADITQAIDNLALSATVWKLGVPPGDSLAICSDSSGTLNDVGQAYAAWWQATTFVIPVGSSPQTLQLGHVASPAVTHGITLAPGAATLALGHAPSDAAVHGITLQPGTATIHLGKVPAIDGAVCVLGVSNQVLGTQTLANVEAEQGRPFRALRQNQNINTTGWSSAVGFAQDSGYRTTYRDIQLDDLDSWANVPTGGYDTQLTAIFTNLLADASEFDTVYLTFTHETSIAGDAGAGTAPEFAAAFKYIRLMADAMGVSRWSVSGEWIGGPAVWCYCGWDRMFVGLNGVGPPDAADSYDTYDPDQVADPGTSLYELVASDVYNDFDTGEDLKYGLDAATLVQPIIDAALARGKDWMIGEMGCADGTTTLSHQNKAAWLTSFADLIESCGDTGPGVCRLICTTVKISSSNFQPESSAESLAAWREFVNRPYFSANLESPAYGLTLTAGGSILALGHVASPAAAYGIALTGSAPGDLLLSLGKVPSPSAARGIALLPGGTTLQLGHVASPAAAHGLRLLGAATLHLGHVSSPAAAHGIRLAPGSAPLRLGRVPSPAEVYGINLVAALAPVPSLAVLVPCYNANVPLSVDAFLIGAPVYDHREQTKTTRPERAARLFGQASEVEL